MKPKLLLTKSSNGKYICEMKNNGVLLYKTEEEVKELISWNQYEVIITNGEPEWLNT